MFAANVGIKFYTPEEFFLGYSATDKWSWGSVDPRSLLALTGPTVAKPLLPIRRELLLMVGCPASGKTSWSKRFVEAVNGHDGANCGYVRVCNDELGSKKKAQATAVKAWRNNQSVIVDNTNPSLETRKEWIDLARSVGVNAIRCVHVTTERAIAEHLNVFRELTTERARVPEIVYNIYWSKFEAPVLEEGFNLVLEVPFQLEQFTDRETEDLFMQWTC
jgi:bifunctional polynucleotide phosphatase/kinase